VPGLFLGLPALPESAARGVQGPQGQSVAREPLVLLEQRLLRGPPEALAAIR
jgi:hypothetical protein